MGPPLLDYSSYLDPAKMTIAAWIALAESINCARMIKGEGPIPDDKAFQSFYMFHPEMIPLSMKVDFHWDLSVESGDYAVYARAYLSYYGKPLSVKRNEGSLAGSSVKKVLDRKAILNGMETGNEVSVSPLTATGEERGCMMTEGIEKGGIVNVSLIGDSAITKSERNEEASRFSSSSESCTLLQTKEKSISDSSAYGRSSQNESRVSQENDSLKSRSQLQSSAKSQSFPYLRKKRFICKLYPKSKTTHWPPPLSLFATFRPGFSQNYIENHMIVFGKLDLSNIPCTEDLHASVGTRLPQGNLQEQAPASLDVTSHDCSENFLGYSEELSTSSGLDCLDFVAEKAGSFGKSLEEK